MTQNTDDRPDAVTTDAPAKPTDALASPALQGPPAELTEAERVKLARDDIAAADVELKEIGGGFEQLRARIEALYKIKDKAVSFIADHEEKFSDAEMVKRVQAQTQRQLQQRADQREALEKQFGPIVGKHYASALDSTLAQGGKRSVMLVNGQPVVAPHPRSPEGIRNYGLWVHGGARTMGGGMGQ